MGSTLIHRRRRPAAAAGVLAAAALVLTACGGGTGGGPAAPTTEDTGGAQETASPEESSPEASADGGGDQENVTIRYSWWGSDSRREMNQEVIDAFQEQYPHIKIEPDYTDWGGYWDKLSTSVAGGDTPDVMTMEERYLAEYASRGVLAELSVLDLDISKVDDSIIASGTVEDGVYGVATGVNAYAIIADPVAIQEAGLEMPDDTTWTWAEYEELANAVSAASGGQVVGVQDSGTNEAGLNIIARQQGQSLYNPDGTLGVSEDIVASWWQRGLDLQEAGGQPPVEITVETESASPEQSLLGTHKAAMVWNWTNTLAAYANASGRDLELLRVPGETEFDRSGMYFKPAMFYSISSTSKHPEAAALFVDFMLNSTEAGEILLSDRGLPANTEVRAAIQDKLEPGDRKAAEFLGSLEEIVVDGPPVPPVGSGAVQDITRRHNQATLYGQSSAEQSAAAWTAEVNQAIG